MDLVPEEAIEAAARLLTSHNFDGMGADHQRYLRARAIQALEAAAPLILAAWAESVAREFWHDSHISKVLRSRASVLRGEGDPK